ncbi:MAG: hypothetical protein ABI867_24050 [Kofleriaceae bacterium]
MQTLASAIESASWPLALDLALAKWRETRTPELADLIDRIGAHCGSPPPRDAPLHAWWIEHAAPYDPAMITPLLDRVTLRLRSSDGTWAVMRERWIANPIIAALALQPELPQSRNWIERLAAILTWPDDPRVARVLADWLTSHEIQVRSPAFAAVYGAIADRLVQLADVRVIRTLEAFLGDPTPSFRDQSKLVERVYDSIDEVTQHDGPALPSVFASGLDELWQAVGDQPGDLGARVVLGDALVAAGDARGELIALQLAPDGGERTARGIKRLLETWWEAWLGPVAAIAVRDGTEFRNGMLEVLRAGYPGTPLRAWTVSVGHRELRTVHTVRCARVDPVAYARFVATIEHLQVLQIDARESLLELARLHARLPITVLEYSQPADRVDELLPSALETLRGFAPCAPRLGRIVLDPEQLDSDLVAIATGLPALFPELRRIEIPAPSRVAARELAARFAAVPLVVIV